MDKLDQSNLSSANNSNCYHFVFNRKWLWRGSWTKVFLLNHLKNSEVRYKLFFVLFPILELLILWSSKGRHGRIFLQFYLFVRNAPCINFYLINDAMSELHPSYAPIISRLYDAVKHLGYCYCSWSDTISIKMKGLRK